MNQNPVTSANVQVSRRFFITNIHCILLGYELSYHSTFQLYTANNVIPGNTEDAVQVSNYASDTINPELTSFTLDMDSDVLTLTFNKPVQFSNMVPH